MWGLADDAPERASEVRLIAHATTQSDLADRIGGCQHEALGKLDSTTRDIGVRRHAKCTFEYPAEVTAAEARNHCQILNANSSRKVGVDMRGETSGLPFGETAARK